MERLGVREDTLSRSAEARDGEECGSGEAGDCGLRANTGTEEKWSSGIRIFAKHLRQTSWLHI